MNQSHNTKNQLIKTLNYRYSTVVHPMRLHQFTDSKANRKMYSALNFQQIIYYDIVLVNNKAVHFTLLVMYTFLNFDVCVEN